MDSFQHHTFDITIQILETKKLILKWRKQLICSIYIVQVTKIAINFQLSGNNWLNVPHASWSQGELTGTETVNFETERYAGPTHSWSFPFATQTKRYENRTTSITLNLSQFVDEN